MSDGREEVTNTRLTNTPSSIHLLINPFHDKNEINPFVIELFCPAWLYCFSKRQPIDLQFFKQWNLPNKEDQVLDVIFGTERLKLVRDSSVSIVTMLRAERPGFGSRQWQGFLLFATASRPAPGPTQPPMQWAPLCLGVKRPVVLGYGLDDRRFDFRQELGIFSSPPRPDRLCGTHSLHPVGTRGFFLGLKRSGCEADHSPPSSAEV